MSKKHHEDSNTVLMFALGLVIKTARKKYCRQKGLSMNKLAQLAGITASTVCVIEAGTRSATIGTLREIARVLDVPLSRLVATAEELAETKEIIELMKKQRELKNHDAVIKLELEQALVDTIARTRN